MNPCPCGHLGDGSDRCHCSSEKIARYRGRISGPLLDRIDMHVEVPRQAIAFKEGFNPADEEPSSRVLERVTAARQRQQQRQQKPNQALEGREVDRYAAAGEAGQHLLRQAMERLGLSMRAYHRILKVARTIADLEAEETIQTQHISEAIGLRRLDRPLSGI